MARVVDLLPREPTPIELVEEASGPLRVLVQDADGSRQSRRHLQILAV
jgi:hypothetical protein